MVVAVVFRAIVLLTPDVERLLHGKYTILNFDVDRNRTHYSATWVQLTRKKIKKHLFNDIQTVRRQVYIHWRSH